MEKQVGPHWDVHNPKSGTHINMYPGENAEKEVSDLWKVTLTCEDIVFHSSMDEVLFLHWLKLHPAIAAFNGIRNVLYLYLEKTVLNDDELGELIALFYRYKIDMKQLQIFLNENNKEWFYDSKKYWYRRVFGSVTVK